MRSVSTTCRLVLTTDSIVSVDEKAVQGDDNDDVGVVDTCVGRFEPIMVASVVTIRAGRMHQTSGCTDKAQADLCDDGK